MRCGPHPYRLIVTPVTSPRQTACSKERHRQQRSVPSFSNWDATPPTPSLVPPSPTQRGSNSGRCDTCNEHAAAVSHCCRHDQTKGLHRALYTNPRPPNASETRKGDMPIQPSVSFQPLVGTQGNNKTTAKRTPVRASTHTHRSGVVGARTRRRMRRPTADTPSHSAHTAKRHPHSKHTTPVVTHQQGEEVTHRHRLQFSPTDNGIRPQPRSQHTTQTEQAISQRATRRSDSSSIHDAAPHSMRSHGAHHFLNRTHSSSIPLKCFR
ncbi:hypothetical protein TCDM_13072 [Trypanosoma cruzi Dm28c]|uniref:Uncharacterized protein n=1 Tax=Trypanosoma cruzi Dm28c TaxID=1416333 RepID=V5ATL8_TRYCR|nr:hypothetical protein TCDM_13072 [Trypanosoma cruzi Dm28c]